MKKIIIALIFSLNVLNTNSIDLNYKNIGTALGATSSIYGIYNLYNCFFKKRELTAHFAMQRALEKNPAGVTTITPAMNKKAQKDFQYYRLKGIAALIAGLGTVGYLKL